MGQVYGVRSNLQSHPKGYSAPAYTRARIHVFCCAATKHMSKALKMTLY